MDFKEAIKIIEGNGFTKKGIALKIHVKAGLAQIEDDETIIGISTGLFQNDNEKDRDGRDVKKLSALLITDKRILISKKTIIGVKHSTFYFKDIVSVDSSTTTVFGVDLNVTTTTGKWVMEAMNKQNVKLIDALIKKSIKNN